MFKDTPIFNSSLKIKDYFKLNAIFLQKQLSKKVLFLTQTKQQLFYKTLPLLLNGTKNLGLRYKKNVKTSLLRKNKNINFFVALEKNKNIKKKNKKKYNSFSKKKISKSVIFSKKIKNYLAAKKYKAFLKMKRNFDFSNIKKKNLFAYILNFKKSFRFSYGLLKNKKLLQYFNKLTGKIKHKFNNFLSSLNRTLLHIFPKFYVLKNFRQTKNIVRYGFINLNKQKSEFPYRFVEPGDLLIFDNFHYFNGFFKLRRQYIFTRFLFFNRSLLFFSALRNLVLICLYKYVPLNLFKFSRIYDIKKQAFMFSFLI